MRDLLYFFRTTLTNLNINEIMFRKFLNGKNLTLKFVVIHKNHSSLFVLIILPINKIITG